MKSITLKMSAACLATALMADVSWSAPVTIQNPSFETPVTADYVSANGPNGNDGLPGWSHPAWMNTYIIKSGGGTASISGVTDSQFLFLEPYNDTTNSYVYQNTGTTFTPGSYTLRVDVGYAAGFATGGGASATFQLAAYNPETSVYTYLASTTVSAATLAGINGSLGTYTNIITVAGTEAWLGQQVVVFLKGSDGTFQNVSYDNVSLDFQPSGTLTPITVENSSFEILNTSAQAELASQGYTKISTSPAQPVLGWTDYNDGQIYIVTASASLIDNLDGTNSLYLEPWYVSNPLPGFQQNVRQALTNTLQAGTYYLTVGVGFSTAFGHNQGIANAVFGLSGYDGTNYSGLQTTVVYSSLQFNHLKDYTMILTVPPGDPRIGQQLVITLGGVGGNTQNVNYDNVRLYYQTNAAPIPVYNSPVSIVVTNFSFENPVVSASPGYVSITSQSDWHYPQFPNIYLLNNASQGITSGADGLNSLLLEPWAGYSGSQATQTLTNTLQPGIYTLTVAVGYGQTLNSLGSIPDFSLFTEETGGSAYHELANTSVGLPQLYVNGQTQGLLSDQQLSFSVATNNPYLGQKLLIRLRASQPQSSVDWVVYDNVRLTLQSMQSGTPGTLTIVPSGANVVISWTSGQLESTTNLVNGVWSPVPAAVSPLTVAPTGPARFYRTAQ